MNPAQVVMGFRKELWEFKRTLFWVPVVIALFMIAGPLLKLLLLESQQTQMLLQGLSNNDNLSGIQGFARLFLSAIMGVFAPFILIGLILQLYYFTTCLFDERRDQSIYFWRSLPVSDAQSILIKLLTGALVVPAVFMLAATAVVLVYLFLAFIGSGILDIRYDISLWGLWGSADIVSSLASIWLNLLFYALWMFPLFSWLMLASMFANKAPFLWAVLPVAMLLVLETYIMDYANIESRFLREALWDYFALAKQLIPDSMQDINSSKEVLLAALWSKISIVGTLLGVGFISLVYWLRISRSHS
ncbi:hypothetical protein [Paraglaciecola sp. 2405UD69-4]|uniref:hypothetical protein n=1 Tax=Paraglaciecola sp. 2405UD69-4 TaxID=3391836 RepID=UPI0039C99BED